MMQLRLHWLVWIVAGKRVTAREGIERKEVVKETAKSKAKGERKARARTTAGKDTVEGGLSNTSNGGLNRSVVTLDTRKLNVATGMEEN